MKKIRTGIIIVIILAIVLGVVRLINIRNDFKSYLEVNYPNEEFKVTLPKIDFLYGSYYSDVSSVNDNTDFHISKSWNTKRINEQYLIIKNQNKNNLEIDQIFKNTTAEKYIKSVSGGSKIPTSEKNTYELIYLLIVPESEMVSVTKDIFQVLKEKNIVVNQLYISYEKDKNVYEGHFSDSDYDLKISEIEEKIVKIK